MAFAFVVAITSAVILRDNGHSPPEVEKKTTFYTYSIYIYTYNYFPLPANIIHMWRIKISKMKQTLVLEGMPHLLSDILQQQWQYPSPLPKNNDTVCILKGYSLGVIISSQLHFY